MFRFIRGFIVLAVLVALGAGCWTWFKQRDTEKVSYRTAPVKRDDLVATISATGTVEPEELVDVGAQVAGRIESLGVDPSGKRIDYGSKVSQGEILATIDDSLYSADVSLAQAQLDQAKASVIKSQADVGQSQAKLDQAKRDWERAQRLGPSDALAQNSYDAYRAAYEVAQANLELSRAAVTQAQGAVAQAMANLDRAQRNLSYCTIKSPVNGVIIDRRVNTGQTVVSSLNAPSLFLIAKDLRQLQVWVAVNEADIGQIHPGQPVTFTVDAFPGESFHGVVNKVRLNATMTQNVVTYTVEVDTDNSDGRLLPYLTANLNFEVSRHDNVLMVPNAALRWAPQESQVAPDAREAFASRRGGENGSTTMAAAAPTTRRSRRATTRPSGAAVAEYRPGTLWVEDGAFVRPIHVRAGASDGSMTEIRSDTLTEGTQVIVNEIRAQSGTVGATNPFTPQLRRGRSGGGSPGGGAGGGGGGGRQG